MRRLVHFSLTVFCVVSVVLAFQGTAQAYVDPGQGLLALQIVGSTMAGVGFYFRRKIGKYFARRPSSADSPLDEPSCPKEPAESKPE